LTEDTGVVFMSMLEQTIEIAIVAELARAIKKSVKQVSLPGVEFISIIQIEHPKELDTKQNAPLKHF
jgi:hypothetical protein